MARARTASDVTPLTPRRKTRTQSRRRTSNGGMNGCRLFQTPVLHRQSMPSNRPNCLQSTSRIRASTRLASPLATPPTPSIETRSSIYPSACTSSRHALCPCRADPSASLQRRQRLVADLSGDKQPLRRRALPFSPHRHPHSPSSTIRQWGLVPLASRTAKYSSWQTRSRRWAWTMHNLCQRAPSSTSKGPFDWEPA